MHQYRDSSYTGIELRFTDSGLNFWIGKESSIEKERAGCLDVYSAIVATSRVKNSTINMSKCSFLVIDYIS